MTLVFQIAGGIVLSVLVLRFWRQALWLSAIALGLAVIVVGLLLANGRGYIKWDSLAGIPFIIIFGAALRARKERKDRASETSRRP